MSRVLTAGAEAGNTGTYQTQCEYADQVVYEVHYGVSVIAGETVPGDGGCSAYGYLGERACQWAFANSDELYFRDYIYVVQPSYTAGIDTPILYLTDGSGVERFHSGNENWDLRLMVDGDDGSLKLFREQGAGTLLATSAAGVIVPQTRHKLEGYVLIADSGGRFKLTVDEAVAIDFTGDTLSTINFTGGESIYVSGDTYIGGQVNIVHDNIAINDTNGSENNSWVGDSDVFGVTLAGMGTGTNDLTGTGEATDRWKNVDEVPVNDTDYNSASVAGRYDLYTLSTAWVFTSIKAVAVWARVGYPGAASTFKFVAKYNGTEYRSAALAPTFYTTYTHPNGLDGPQHRRWDWSTAPDGTPWTPAKLAATEWGLEVASATEMRFYQLFVEVDGVTSTPPCGGEQCNLASSDEVLFVDATYQDVIVTLLQGETLPAFGAGHIYYIKRIDDSLNSVTIDPSPTTIDGLTSFSLEPLDGVAIATDGDQWWILADRIPFLGS